MKINILFCGMLLMCSANAWAQEDRHLNGETLYLKECGICHLPGEMGSNILSRRLGKTQGILAARTDLTRGLIMEVARRGQLMMPRFSRVEVSDRELEAIADYLTDPKRLSEKNE
jgi:mono/diheme cytochrome c family protein